MPLTATILCVDDDEDDLYFIREAIVSHAHAFHMEEAHNGWEAINYLQAALAAGDLPCLVIMDINMPRMDGKQTVKKIREHEGLVALPIAVLTTSSNSNDRKHFEDQGVHFLTKPFDYGIFKQQIVDLLGLYAAPRT